MFSDFGELAAQSVIPETKEAKKIKFTIAPDYRLERVIKPQYREIEKPKLRLLS